MVFRMTGPSPVWLIHVNEHTLRLLISAIVPSNVFNLKPQTPLTDKHQTREHIGNEA